MDNRKSLFGPAQSDLTTLNNILQDFNKVTITLGDVKTVQDIISHTNQLVKIIQTANQLNKDDQIVRSK